MSSGSCSAASRAGTGRLSVSSVASIAPDSSSCPWRSAGVEVGGDPLEQQPGLGEHQLDVDAAGILIPASCCQVATGSDQACTSKVHAPVVSGVTQAS